MSNWIFIEKAKTQVYVNMNRGDIEEACDRRGIKGRNRSSLEEKLIKALAKEYEAFDEKLKSAHVGIDLASGEDKHVIY